MANQNCSRLAVLALLLLAGMVPLSPTAFADNAVQSGPIDEDAEQAARNAKAAAAELDMVATDFNDLFPAHGIWLYTEYSRPGYEQYRTKQWQKFVGNFQKTAAGTYEQAGFCETEFFENGTSRNKSIDTTIHRFSVDNGKVMLRAIHINARGDQNIYGPSNVLRLGNGMEFQETSPMVAGGNWTFSTFYRTRDGHLSSTRHWNAPYIDTWSIEQPPGQEKKL